MRWLETDADNQSWKHILKMQALGFCSALVIWGAIFGAYMLYARISAP